MIQTQTLVQVQVRDHIPEKKPGNPKGNTNRPSQSNTNQPQRPKNNQTNQNNINDNISHTRTSGDGAPFKRQQNIINSNSSHRNQNNINQFIWNKNGFLKSQNNTEHRMNSSDNTNSLISRFRQLATGAYKYNPFLINQVKNLNQLDGKVTDSDIYSLFRKQSFRGNEYLNSLQKGTSYFRFQYFNPLNSSKYYENLDDQVLALITGEIGSMPELKKPTDKEDKNHSAFKNHSADEITTNNDGHSKDYDKKKKIHRSLLSLSIAIIGIFLGVTGLYIFRRKE
ncbi:hypothetical protein IHE60_10770 [Staphylococcus epidermidis]|nr:hypothetical protein [Staphylococcus epidermidis]